MNAANNPKNQNGNGLRNLVQISTTRAATHNPNPWVVVENPGQDNEEFVIDFPTMREAFRYIERNYTDDDCNADVMRREDDGTLTTIY